MKTWNIAKILIQSCSSPEDVSRILATLRDPKEVESVCELLSSFSAIVPPEQPLQISNGNDNVVAKNGSLSNRTKGGTKKISASIARTSASTSEEAIADKLEPLFRNNGMTNKQVEEWVTTNFNVRATVGKSSLRKYLIRVLLGADLGLKNRILGAAQQLANSQDSKDSDLVKYWDGFDKHFGVSE